MNDSANKIMELLEQGRVVVAKQGEKADPEQMATAVLEYCEAAGYTLDEIFSISNKIRNAAWDVREEKCKGMKFSIIKEAEAFAEKHPAKSKTEQGEEIKGITIDLPTHGIQQAAKASK